MTFRLSHLALLLAVSIVAAALGGVVVTWQVANEEFRDVLDEDLENQGELLAELLLAAGDELDTAELRELLEDAFEPEGEESLWVTVYDTRAGTSVSNRPHHIPLGDPGREELRRTFDGHEWYGYQSDEGHLVVQLLRREDLYREVQEEVIEDIVTPAVAGSLASLLLLGLLIAFSLWPLTRLARQLETRNSDSLAPVRLATPAREIQVLRDAVNGLMRGVGDVLTRERRFAADVAHELRTPLTTLKLELASSEPDLAAAKAEVGRLSRLVEQLLTLARLEEGQWRQHFEPVALAELFGRVLERHREAFRRARIGLESRLLPVSVAGDPVLLEILLRNLLDNVADHCPPGCRAEVVLEVPGGDPLLTVSDTGPGIEESRRRGLSQGASRLDSRSGGHGLGLAICHRIAEVHGASLRFEARPDGQSGLRVEVLFPG
ncbi:MAG TPA: ATP-binding protein [Woeseiaceae bacterium]|nr:ATP-binding protein [Woeseiaceae bacterium]